MILSNNDIQAEIERGGLRFHPSVNPNLMSSSSIDLRLGDTFTVPRVPLAGVSIHIDPLITSPEDALQKYAEIVKVGKAKNSRLNRARSSWAIRWSAWSCRTTWRRASRAEAR